MSGEDLQDNLNRLLSHLESIRDTLPMILLLLNPYQKKANQGLQEFIKNNVDEIEEEDGEKGISVKDEEVRIFLQLSKNAHISNLASKIIPESLFVSLISQYDAFTNDLLKILFDLRPEYINKSERELSFSQLVDFGTIESARKYIIEKEIETVLRKSHSEQFDYLEKKIGIQLRKNLPVWKEFIEITQRRNLFVHCDGIVSSQYLKVCKENGCEINDVKLNNRLKIDIDYFIRAYECLYELGIKLTHTIWRKLLKEDIENADRKLNSICYDLLNALQFKLADVILDFAIKQEKHHNDASKNLFIINRALSLSLNSKDEEAQKIIISKDWSASSNDFRLADYIIRKDYEKAYKLMRKIGSDGEVDKEDYRSWPLFFLLRKEDKFKETFKNIFKEDYSALEIPKTQVQELISEMIKKEPELKSKTTTKELSTKQKQAKEK